MEKTRKSTLVMQIRLHGNVVVYGAVASCWLPMYFIAPFQSGGLVR